MNPILERHWQSSTRYYCARMYRDMLGDVVIDVCWGGRFNNLGRKGSPIILNSIDDGLRELKKIGERRVQKKYHQVP